MADLAELGLRIQSQEVAVADERLDDFAAAAGRAEGGADRLAMAARRADNSAGAMNVALRQQQRVLDSVRGATGLTSHEAVNLSRQFADVGVSIASGMPIWMVAVQQGTQIADTFQMAATRGVGFRAVLASITAMAAPLIPVLAGVAAVASLIAAPFALGAREMNRENKNLIDSLGLTEDQLEKVKNKTVTMGDVMVGTWRAMAKALNEAFGPEIARIRSDFDAWLDQMNANTIREVKTLVGLFMGAFEAVRATWRMLPAALGDAAVTAANAVLRGVEAMINGGIALLNKLIEKANGLVGRIPGMEVAIPRLDDVKFTEFTNEWSGTMKQAGEAGRAAFDAGFAKGGGVVDGAIAAIRRESLAAYRERVLKEAGDGPKAKTGRSEAEREYDRLIAAGQQFRDGLIKEREGLGLTAIEQRKLDAAAMARTLTAKGETLEAVKLAQAILREADALDTATAAYERNEAIKAAKKMMSGGITGLKRDAEKAGMPLTDQARFDVQANVRDMMSDLRLSEMTPELKAMADELERLAVAAALPREIAQELRSIDDVARSAGRGMAEAFGEAGKAVSDLMTTLTSYQSQLAEIDVAVQNGSKTYAQAAREKAAAGAGAFGDMASAAKGFFKENSSGYRAMLAIERMYRLEQLAMAAQAMLFGKQETAMTVAQNMIKATSHGIVAAAKAMAGLPFPLNIAAMAATLAALAAIGVKIAGGGGGGGSARSVAGSVETAQGLQGAADRGRESFAQSVAQSVRVVVESNDDKFRAFIAGETDHKIVAAERSAVRTSAKNASKGAPAVNQTYRRLGTTG